MKSWVVAGLVALASVVVGIGRGAAAAPPPVEDFGRIPAVIDVRISPDGRHVAILGGAAAQRVVSIATIDQPGLPTLALGDIEAIGMAWAGDEHVIVRLAQWRSFGVREKYRFERNLSVDTQAKPAGILLENDPNSIWLVEQPVLGVTRQPARVFVRGLAGSTASNTDAFSHMEQKSQRSGFQAALFSVDPAGGAGKRLEVGNYDTVLWEMDPTGEPRIRQDHDNIAHTFSVWRRPPGGRYVQVYGGGVEAIRAYHGYSGAEDAIYFDEGDQLVRLKFADGKKEVVASGLGAESAHVLWDPTGMSAVGVQRLAATSHYDWFDPQLASAYANLSHAFAGKAVALWDWSADRSRLVARVSAPDTPTTWYLYDRARKELSPLGEEYPELKGAAFGVTQWVPFKARDGLALGAYLTLPPGAGAGAKPPLIVLPHGGPAARDDEDFDFITQFLASRGYAVLRPQFRGSAGFGAAVRAAGRGEWGGKMQTDLLDAMAAVAGQVDTGRACIVGASFGGYSAMAGAAFHSDSYRCAVAIAGISDLGLLLVEESRVYGRDSTALEELRGELSKTSMEGLAAASPGRHAGEVRIPLLLIHGDQDTVVPLEQSMAMQRAMAAAKKPVELVVLQGENHYLTRAQTRTQTLSALEAFLAKNLPVSR
jgi:pimeloyl-ACP methyl ester carboxylesterase